MDDYYNQIDDSASQ